jgi:hypothetical protein
LKRYTHAACVQTSDHTGLLIKKFRLYDKKYN